MINKDEKYLARLAKIQKMIEEVLDYGYGTVIIKIHHSKIRQIEKTEKEKYCS